MLHDVFYSGKSMFPKVATNKKHKIINKLSEDIKQLLIFCNFVKHI